jgi:hypothetical protein
MRILLPALSSQRKSRRILHRSTGVMKYSEEIEARTLSFNRCHDVGFPPEQILYYFFWFALVAPTRIRTKSHWKMATKLSRIGAKWAVTPKQVATLKVSWIFN